MRVDQIERHLHADEIESISEWCRRFHLPVAKWPAYTGCRGWLDLALSRAVDQALRQGRARSRTAALRLVCGDFGVVSGDSVRRRWERLAA